MKTFLKIAAAVLFLYGCVQAQTPTRVRSVTSLPATCQTGTGVEPTDVVTLSSGGTSTLEICTATNTWSAVVSCTGGVCTSLLGSNNTFTGSNQFTQGAQLGPFFFASLPSSPDGTIVFCPDCQATSPCLGSGTGAFAQRINSQWICTAGGGGGGSPPGGPFTSVQINQSGVFSGDSQFAYQTSTHTVLFPDGTTWSPSALTFPATGLILNGSFPSLNDSVITYPLNQGVSVASAADGTNGCQTSLALDGANRIGIAKTQLLLIASCSTGNIGLLQQMLSGSFTDSLGYVASTGSVEWELPSGQTVFMLGNDRTVHLYNALYAKSKSPGAAGAVFVSQGSGIIPAWSSDLTGPFDVVGSFGTCTASTTGLSDLCFGPSGHLQSSWNGDTRQDLVRVNNIPAAGITGSIEPAQLDLTLATGLGGFFVGINASTQYNIPEWGASGVGPITGPFNDAADAITSTIQPINLASSGLGPGIVNCTSTGTTVNKLAKLSSSAGASCAVIASIVDTQGEVGVVVGRAGTTGTAVVATEGLVSLIMDGATTVNDWVINSPSVAGDGRDTGSTTCPTTGAQAIGRVQSTNASGGTYVVLLGGCDTTGGGGGGGLADPGGNGVVVRTALNTTTAVTLTAGSSNIVITNGTGTGGNPTVDIGSAVITASNTQTLTNKTYDTAGSGNIFKINGQQITAVSGNTGTVCTTSGTLTSGDAVKFDANGNCVDSGATVVTPSSTTTFTNKTSTDPTNNDTLVNLQGPLSPVTGTGAATTLYTYTIPGGLMGANTCIRVTVGFQHTTGSGSVSYTWQYASTSLTGTMTSSLTTPGQSGIILCNNNATNSQFATTNARAFVGATAFAAAFATASKDSTVNETLNFQMNAANSEAVTPENFMVEALH